MDDPHSTTSLLCCFPTTEKRERAIDKSLETVGTALDLLDQFKDVVPVAGVGVAVPVLKAIVAQISKTRTNSRTAEELAKRVQTLVKLIDETVKDVQSQIESYERRVSNGKDLAREKEHFNKPRQFNKTMESLASELQPLSAEIESIQEGNCFSRLYRSNEIESQLNDVKEKITNAMEDLRTRQSIILHATVEHFAAVVLELMQKATDDKDLAALPRAQASHRVVGVSKLLDGTQVDLLCGIEAWAVAPNVNATNADASSAGGARTDFSNADRPDNVYLLTGGAGRGKSTVALEICTRLESKNQLGASYFFVRSDGTSDMSGLASIDMVIPTIAYQIATYHPEFRPYIANASCEYMKLPSNSIETQLTTLILDPLKKAQQGQPSLACSDRPIVIVLDALDEARGDLTGLLLSLKRLLDQQSQLRILLTSRPEQRVIRPLNAAGIKITNTYMDMDSMPRDTVRSDIRRFITARFKDLWWQKRILETYPDIIDILVKVADDLFILAKTIMQYVDHKTTEVSIRRTTDVVNSTTKTDSMLALDKLYTSVLESAYDGESMNEREVRRRVTAVLAGLVVLQDPITVDILVPMMNIKKDAAVGTIEELRSIISCAGRDLQKDIIRPLHLTLREFLVDENRCTNNSFYIDRRVHHLQAAKSCLRIMNKELRRDMCKLGDLFKDEVEYLESRVREHIPSHVQYACMYWSAHIAENELNADSELQRLLLEFCEKKLLQWVEALAVMNRLDLAVHGFLRVRPWAKENSRISAIVEDGYQLVGRFFEPINESPGQIYTSALSFAPKCSLVDLFANEDGSNCMVIPRLEVWGSCLNVVKCKVGFADFSRDGRYLCTPSWRINANSICDATTGKPLKTVKTSRCVVSADIHPNNRSVVSLLEDGTVEEWNWTAEVQSTRLYALDEKDRNELVSDYGQVVYSDAGSRIVCYWSGVEVVNVWSTSDQTRPTQRILLANGTSCITFSLDSDETSIVALLTCNGNDVVVKRWNIDTGDELSSMQMDMDDFKGAQFAKNCMVLVTVHRWKICVWKLKGDSWSQTTTINTDWRACDVTQSGNLIASADEKDIYMWNAESGEPLAVYQGHTSYIRSLQFSPQEDRLVSTSYDGTLRIWDTTQKAPSHAPSDNTNWFYKCVFASSGKHIAAGLDEDETRILLFDRRNSSPLATFTGSMGRVKSLRFSADGSLLASYHRYNGVFLWDVESEEALPRKLVQSDQFDNDAWLVFNATKNKLAVVSPRYGSFKVGIWDISNWPDGNETELGCITSHSVIQGRTPHYLRFSPTDPLSFIRPIDIFEHEKPNVVIVLECTTGTVVKSACDENIHPDMKPAYDIVNNWIVSTKTGRRLLWLPNDRTYRCSDNVISVFLVDGDMVATDSERGIFTLLDMSRLSISA